MPTQAKVIDDQGALELQPETVKAYLRANPQIVINDPDLLCALLPDAIAEEGAVRDVQRVAIEHLRSQTNELIRQRDRAFDTLRLNGSVLRITERAVLAILEARNFEDMINVITKRLPSIIEVDCIVMCMEEFGGIGEDLSLVEDLGVRIVPECAVDAALGEGGNSALKSDTTGIRTLFGDNADDVQSYALIRLAAGPTAPAGLLAIGSHSPKAFHPSQGADMVEFLARIIERQICSWLGLPNE